MRRHFAALALLASLAAPVQANAAAIITEGSFVSTGVPDNNDFQALLQGLGYNRYTSTGASISLTGDSVIDFYFLGSESGNLDSFVIDGTSYAELPSVNFPDGIFLGQKFFAAGDILPGTSGLQFTSIGSGGVPAILGEAGFGIFLKEGWESGVTQVDRFIIGYDDQITNPDDDNHDDLMVLAVVRSVPEPGTWATLLLGFGALGAMMRRKSKAPRVRAAIA